MIAVLSFCAGLLWELHTARPAMAQSSEATQNQDREQIDELRHADHDFEHALEIWGDGRSPQAEVLLKNALSIRSRVLGDNDPAVARVLERLGALDYNRSQFPAAETKFRRAMDIDERRLGDQTVTTSVDMGDLGAALREEHRYSEAESLVKRDLAIRRNLLPANHPRIAAGLDNLGRIYFGERRYSDATAALEEKRRIDLISSPDKRTLGSDDLFLERIDAARNWNRNVYKLEFSAIELWIISVTILVSLNVFFEKQILNGRGKIYSKITTNLATISTIGFYATTAFLGAAVSDSLLGTIIPSVLTDPMGPRSLGKIGAIVAVGLGTIVIQFLNNIGRWMAGISTKPIVFFPRASRMTISTSGLCADGKNDHINWFAGMEYYALMLNRTFKILITDSGLCGAKVRGLVSNPVSTRTDMYDQEFWVNTRSAKIYEHMDPSSEQFLLINASNFKISWADIIETMYLPTKKWGMGSVPHSGRLLIRLRSGQSREFILLGRQDGFALNARIDNKVNALKDQNI